MRIAILDGHTDHESLTTGLCDAYARGAESARHEVRRITPRDLAFEPVLRGYRDRGELEPDLVAAQETISWCEHLVVVHPVWWGQMPALLKGFIDRTFLPGWAFKFHEDDPWWDRLLAGRSARLIQISATPVWAMWVANWNAPLIATKGSVLSFCGFKPVRTTQFGGVNKDFTEAQAAPWLAKVERLGAAAR